MQQTGLSTGGIVAEKSFFILFTVGVFEIYAGILSLSVALIADGVQSFAASIVSMIAWIGLRLSKKAPDGKFHFGYYRIETLGSLIAAFFMAVLGGVVIYRSYLLWLAPTKIVNADFAMIVAGAASAVGIVLFIYIKSAAAEYGSLSLKTSASNTAVDTASSVAALIAVALNRYFGILHADSIAGVLIALIIFVAAYSITKEASLVLTDACQCGEVVPDVEKTAKGVPGVIEVRNIRMRKTGPYLTGDMRIAVNGSMSVTEANKIAADVEERVRKEFNTIVEINVRITPFAEPKNDTSYD